MTLTPSKSIKIDLESTCLSQRKIAKAKMKMKNNMSRQWWEIKKRPNQKQFFRKWWMGLWFLIINHYQSSLATHEAINKILRLRISMSRTNKRNITQILMEESNQVMMKMMMIIIIMKASSTKRKAKINTKIVFYKRNMSQKLKLSLSRTLSFYGKLKKISEINWGKIFKKGKLGLRRLRAAIMTFG